MGPRDPPRTVNRSGAETAQVAGRVFSCSLHLDRSLQVSHAARPSHHLLGPMDQRAGNPISVVAAETTGLPCMYQGPPSFSYDSWHGWAHLSQSRMIVTPFLRKEHQLEPPCLSPNPTALLASLMTFGNSLPHLRALVS